MIKITQQVSIYFMKNIHRKVQTFFAITDWFSQFIAISSVNTQICIVSSNETLVKIVSKKLIKTLLSKSI